MSSVIRLNILIALVASVWLVGCSGTTEQLKQHGVEVHSGKVMRVFRF